MDRCFRLHVRAGNAVSLSHITNANRSASISICNLETSRESASLPSGANERNCVLGQMVVNIADHRLLLI